MKRFIQSMLWTMGERVLNSIPEVTWQRLIDIIAVMISAEIEGYPYELSPDIPTCFWIDPDNDRQRLQVMECPFVEDILRKCRIRETPMFDGIVFVDSFENLYGDKPWIYKVFTPSFARYDYDTEHCMKIQILLENVKRENNINVLLVGYADAIDITQSSDVYDFAKNFPMNSKFHMLWLYGNRKELSRTISRL